MDLFGSGRSAKIKAVKHIATYMYPINDNAERIRFGRLGLPINMPDYIRPTTQSRRSAPSSLQFLKPPEDRPTPTLHAAMLTIYENPNAKLSELAKYIKARGWVTSDPTIYGSKDRKGVFDSLVSLGFATKDYKLTEKALEWIDGIRIVEKAKNTGSDLHKQLMRKTVEKLHEENTMVVIPEGDDVPDLIAYPMSKGDKKYLWDDKKRRAYEIQTTARKENILTNMERDLKFGLLITWVCYDRDMLEEIKNLQKIKTNI